MTTNQYPKPRGVSQGTVGVISGDLTRYSLFSMCLLNMFAYSGDYVCNWTWQTGADITTNTNNICRKTEGDWLWMIGDDHAFRHDLLEKLVLRDVDVVVPLCLQRAPPYLHLAFSGEDEQANEEGTHVHHVDLPASGIHEVYAAGNAGMLIKRRVLDAIGDPWFETYGKQNEDLEFCRKIREAGFKIHVDLDNLLGHIAQMIVWPDSNTDYGWGIRMDLGGDVSVPLKRLLKSDALTPV